MLINAKAPAQNATAEALRPWYREPWPWILFGIPALTVVAGFYTLYLAITNPAQVLSVFSGDTKKQAYRTLTAQSRHIEGQLGFNAEGLLQGAFTARETLADKQISVQLYEIRAVGNTPIKANEGKDNISRRHAGGTEIIALELFLQPDGAYRANRALTPTQRQNSYWLEVVGERAAWSLTGLLPAGDKALLQAQ